MSETKIVGYKKIFGFILPDWVSEKMIKLFSFGLLCCFVMLATYVFFVMPKFDDIKSLKNALASDKTSLASLKKSLDGINKFQEALTESEQNKILSAVPLYYSPDRAIFILRNLASQTGASIVSYTLPSGVLLDTNTVESIGKQGEMVEFSSYPIKMIVSAPVDILLNFITKVESSLPFGVVSDLNLQEVTKLAKGSTNKNVQISLELKYYQSKINKINVNKISPLTEKNLEFESRLTGFDEIRLESSSEAASPSGFVASSSGNMFGI